MVRLHEPRLRLRLDIVGDGSKQGHEVLGLVGGEFLPCGGYLAEHSEVYIKDDALSVLAGMARGEEASHSPCNSLVQSNGQKMLGTLWLWGGEKGTGSGSHEEFCVHVAGGIRKGMDSPWRHDHQVSLLSVDVALGRSESDGACDQAHNGLLFSIAQSQ